MFQDEFQKKKAANLQCENETQNKSEDELFFETTYEEKNDKKSRRDYVKTFETQFVELAAKNDDQQKELDQTKQEVGEKKQGLVETKTNLFRTQQVLIESKRTLTETIESFMTFKQQVEKVMQANPPRS
ncbi:Autophagy-related protein 14 [Bienertia sinuspersici]